jgi:hypothetical protein
MMHSLDKHLADQGFRPSHRSIRAYMTAAKAFGLHGQRLFAPASERGEPFGPSDLFPRIEEWYQDQFGDKVNPDPSPGSAVVLLSGSLWEMRMPKVFGSFDPVVNRDVAFEGESLGRFRPPVVNVIGMVRGLTQAHSQRLSDEDIVTICGVFEVSFPAISKLSTWSGTVLFDQARADYSGSVEALLSQSENFGKARRDTSLCVEKVIKGFLSVSGTTYQRIHHLIDLGDLVAKNLGIHLSATDLGLADCPASASYEKPGTKAEALSAHQAALRLLGALPASAAP